jgi:hypothetical protein
VKSIEEHRRSISILWGRVAAPVGTAAVGLVVAATLSGCSGLHLGTLPGAGPSGAPVAGAAAAGASAAPGAARCKPNGSAIPDGHYSGSIKATINTTMTLTVPGGSIPNAGSGAEAWKGTVDFVSSGGRVTGTITMSELGLSQVGAAGGVQVHSVDDGDLTGTISGTSGAPIVAATGTGEWASLDAPVVGGSGTSTSALNGGLHVTSASCSSITGDAVAMFSDFMQPVAQYLAVSGSGTWVAARK